MWEMILIFETKISSMKETFSVQRPRGTQSLRGTFPLRKMPRGKDDRGLGWAEPFSIHVTLYRATPLPATQGLDVLGGREV